jgi:hypothetical protein
MHNRNGSVPMRPRLSGFAWTLAGYGIDALGKLGSDGNMSQIHETVRSVGWQLLLDRLRA